jgi:hypothetical protein
MQRRAFPWFAVWLGLLIAAGAWFWSGENARSFINVIPAVMSASVFQIEGSLGYRATAASCLTLPTVVVCFLRGDVYRACIVLAGSLFTFGMMLLLSKVGDWARRRGSS